MPSCIISHHFNLNTYINLKLYCHEYKSLNFLLLQIFTYQIITTNTYQTGKNKNKFSTCSIISKSNKNGKKQLSNKGLSPIKCQTRSNLTNIDNNM